MTVFNFHAMSSSSPSLPSSGDRSHPPIFEPLLSTQSPCYVFARIIVEESSSALSLSFPFLLGPPGIDFLEGSTVFLMSFSEFSCPILPYDALSSQFFRVPPFPLWLLKLSRPSFRSHIWSNFFKTHAFEEGSYV